MSIPSDIGAAVRNAQDAERISAIIIPDDVGDRFWTDGAQLLLTTMLMHCYRCYGRRWGWAELLALAELPPEQLHALLTDAHTAIGRRLQPGKTTDSIVMIVAARVSAAAACLHTVGAGKTMHGLRPSGADDEV